MARAPSVHCSDEEQQFAEQTVLDFGSYLYDQLFPLEFKIEYRRLRDHFLDKSLLITSDEPWIPWELVRPVESDDKGILLYDDPPLCEAFCLARWIFGRAAPNILDVAHAVLVQPPSNLAAANSEAGFFLGLGTELPNLQVAGPLQTLSDVLNSFRDGGTQLYHFVCHGNLDTVDPNESKLKLSDGFLTATQITADRQSGLRRAAPMVFLNTCHGGRREYGLTQLGGWSQRFIDSGASAFVGAQWEVNDELAEMFAREFYSRLFGLEKHPSTTLGEAFRQARLAIKEHGRGNPTWLTYVLYGSPFACVRIAEPSS